MRLTIVVQRPSTFCSRAATSMRGPSPPRRSRRRSSPARPPSRRPPAGSLGTFEPGKMVAAFDAYVFNPASTIGEIAIVDTDFGTHLIKVLERSDKFDPKKTKTDGGYSL